MRFRSAGIAPEAIERVYREHLQSFLKVAAGIAGEQAALDVVHGGFVRALRYGGSFRGGSSLEGWIWRIIVNEARDSRRRQKRQPDINESEWPQFAEAESRAGTTIQAAVLRLPLRQREVVFLRYFADLDYRSIAEILGIEPGTVGACLHAAHDSIRDTLAEEIRCSS